jgi:excisionase family DNA binding protein
MELRADPTATPERGWSPAQLAEYLGVPVKTIHQWRYLQKRPPGFRVGRHIRFRPADVRAWENEQSRSPRSSRVTPTVHRRSALHRHRPTPDVPLLTADQ